MTPRGVFRLAGGALVTLGCSLALDPDDLRFLDGDVGAAPDLEVGADDGSGVAEDVGEDVGEDAGPDVAEAGPDVAEPDTGGVDDVGPEATDSGDVAPAPRSVGLLGGASGCTGAYTLITPTLPLSPPCAAACAPGAEGWSVTLEAHGPNAADAAWTVEATKGYGVGPATGKGSTLTVELTLPDDNCTTDDAVPPFTLLVTARYGGETLTANLPITPTLDKGCPAVVCN